MIKTMRTERCPSVNVMLQSSSALVTHGCTLPGGHRGACADDHGNHWLRVSEHLRLLKEDDHE